jgi:hypothetical protein
VAGFQVIMSGRFWVFTEVSPRDKRQFAGLSSDANRASIKRLTSSEFEFQTKLDDTRIPSRRD